MKFFLPDGTDEKRSEILERLRANGHAALYRLTYNHEGDQYELEVGRPRKKFARKTGPRGGYIKNAEPSTYGTETGGTVVLIVSTENVIEVWSEPARGWAVPSIVGRSEVVRSERFDEFLKE